MNPDQWPTVNLLDQGANCPYQTCERTQTKMLQSGTISPGRLGTSNVSSTAFKHPMGWIAIALLIALIVYVYWTSK